MRIEHRSDHPYLRTGLQYRLYWYCTGLFSRSQEAVLRRRTKTCDIFNYLLCFFLIQEEKRTSSSRGKIRVPQFMSPPEYPAGGLAARRGSPPDAQPFSQSPRCGSYGSVDDLQDSLRASSVKRLLGRLGSSALAHSSGVRSLRKRSSWKQAATSDAPPGTIHSTAASNCRGVPAASMSRITPLSFRSRSSRMSG
jgi:hypothetical protein